MRQLRAPFVIHRMIPVIAGVLVIAASSVEAACELPIRPPEPDENGNLPEQGYAGPRQAEGALHFDNVVMKFVECQNGLWVPAEDVATRRFRKRTGS